jgi:heat shock protein HtpX
VANASFYAQAGANRLRSFVLVFVIVAILAALGMAIGYGTSGDARVGLGWLGIFGIIAIVTSLAGYYQGSALVLAASKAREVTPEQAPQLYNVVTELALAGGMPMPRVYIIDDSAPNAFATGRDPKHAAIAVTTGLIQKLDREELQGVVGHELSHVRNYDIRYATLVGVLVGTIALIADVFLRMTFWGGFGRGDSDDDNGGGGGGLQLLVFVFAIILAILAPIFARLVQLAVNRQREYLADTSSVELTRNPYGLERALAKIAGDQDVLEVANRATQHLYFTNPIKRFEKRSKGLFSTHPPIVDRINRLRALTGERPLDEGAVPGVTPGAS